METLLVVPSARTRHEAAPLWPERVAWAGKLPKTVFQDFLIQRTIPQLAVAWAAR